MSNNSVFENNTSQRGNDGVFDHEALKKFLTTSLALHTIFTVAGTSINVWFLTAMLLSPRIRSRLRNKIICGMLLVNLIESAIISPLFLIRTADFLFKDLVIHCYVYAVHTNIYHIQNFLGNWYIFILVCVYTAQVKNFEPVITPHWIKIFLTAVIIASPCVFAVFFVPLTLTNYGATDYYGCLFDTRELVRVYKSLDTIVPQALTILLLVVTAALKRRRYLQGPSETHQVQLIDDRTQTDHWCPFLALLVTAVFTDVVETVITLNPELFLRLSSEIWMSLQTAVLILNYLRLLLIPGMILLFPDIRERIKTWRPCRRSAPPVDLVVTFNKNTSQQAQISL